MRFLALIVLSLFLTVRLNAQLCTPQTVTFPITPTSTLQYTPSYSTGVILFPFTATAGCTYTFSTCGQSSIDTYLRLHNSAYTLLGAWDDQCGLQSTFTWTCPTAGQYYVHLSRFVCTALTAPTTMSYVVSCPTPPCNNPIVNAGPDVVICAGQPSILSGAVSAGTGSGSGGSASSITITISGTGFLDETSWNMSNASGTSVGSGGPYLTASTNTVTLTNVGTGPYSFSLETQGFFNDNNATYTISCNGTTVNTGSITGGQTTTASVTGCGGTGTGGTLPITYVWSPGATLSSTTILNPTATPTVTTTYTLTATSGTCTSTDQMTVFVSPAPTVNAGPDVTICNGQSTVLNGSASAIGGFGGPMDINIFSGSNLDETTWNITNSLGQIIGSGGPYTFASNNTITISNPTNPPYTFNIETQGVSNSNVVGYNILCGGTSISGGLAILTGGQTASTSISGCPGTIPTTMTWSPGATLSSTTVATPTATPSTTTTYTLTASANGCTANDQVVVTVTPGPSVTVNSATICSGQSATLTATPSVTGGTYLWSPGGSTTQTITVSPTTTTNYSVTYSNGACASLPAIGTVTVNAAPTLSVNSSTICPGASATLTATASQSGGTYLWTPGGATTQTLSVTPAATTTYSVTYSLNGCSSSSANGTVTVSNVVDWANIQFPGTSTICQGQTLTIYGQVFEAGVTPPTGQGAGITVQFAYNTSNTNPSTWPSASWSSATYNPLSLINPNNDEYSGIIPALSPGTYYYAFSYTMNGCTIYGGYSASGGGFWNGTSNVNGVLIVNPNITPTFNAVAAICAGGALNALPTTSTNAITGTWSPALSNQLTTTYTFTPTVGLCATTATLTVTVNPLPSAAITAPTTTILTCATPSITLTATGGGTYSWSSGTAVVGTNATLVVTSPGTYMVTVTSANGCTATATQSITQNITVPTAGITPPSTSILTCTTANINLTATGGGTYSWSNGTAVVGTNATLAVSAPGTYIVTVTSANGCSATASQIITQNITAPTAAIASPITTVLNCTTSSIDLNASGGGSYSWTNGTSLQGTSSLLNVSAPGTYVVTVTAANGCTATATQTITQNITTPIPVIATPTSTILTCTNTSIALTASGGGTYSWFDGSTVVGTSSNLTVTAPNTYILTVVGSNGCDATTTITISEDITPPTPSISAASSNLTCTTTSITLTATGGGIYLWSNGNTTASITVSVPGTYSVVVTGSNGCTSNVSQVVTQNITAPTAAITAPSTTVLTCATTSISLVATGGGTYSWSNGATNVGNTATLSVTLPGTYTVTVTGSNGCTATSSLTITQNSAPPTAAITTPSATELTCITTSISLTATGGVSYSWSNGTNVVGTNATLIVTTPGTYTVTVTSAIGCTATASQVITQNVTVPNASITAPSTSVLTCTNPTITLNATGGGTYSWSNGTNVVGTNASYTVNSPGTYTVTVTSPNGCTATASQTITQNNSFPTAAITTPSTSILTCTTTSINLTATGGGTYSWSNGTTVIGTNALLNVTSPGTYTVTVTSLNGCSATAAQVITQNITAPSAQITAPNTSILTCSTTSISLTSTGGGTYSWSNGTAVVGTNGTLSVTTPGTYTVTVTGANGCTATAAQVITQNNTNPTAAITAPATTILTCTTTSITLTATGGGTYSWSNGTAIVGTNAALSVTTPGTYTVTVTSSNGCTATASQVITQNTTLPTIGIIATPSTILSCTNTSITLTASGGVSYSWSNGTSVVGTNAALTVTSAGTYTVTVTGANGCSSSSTQSVTQNTTLPAAAITAATALTCTTTSISLTATGGGTYSWSNGTAVLGTNATLNVTTPGTYTVTVTSSNGCTATAAQVITQSITVPTAAITAPSTTVVTCTTPTISLTATGGGTYSWSNGTAVLGTNATLNVTTSGTYTVTVTATNGCTATATQTITQNNTAPSVTITPPVSSVLTCTTTSISLTANGTGSVSWANPALISVNPTISVTTPGVYTVTLTATNGCIATASQTITQNITAPPAAITTPTTTVLTCTTTAITLTATGGGTYSWSNGTTVVGTNATLSVTTPGTYTVTVTGTNGCTATAAQTITQNTTPPTAGINTPSTTILTCTTTSIPLTATGGGTYSWSNGTTVVGTTPTLTVTSPATYTVTVTAANGCTATASQVITQDIVTPTAAITNNTNATVLDCNTTQISLTGVGGTSASWSNGTSVVSSVANLSVTAAGTYTYTGTNANGCFDTESITITFTPNTNPTFTQIAAICTNGLFTLPTTSTNNVVGTWSPAPNYTTTTTYTFQPNAGLCANTASMTITVHPYPVVTIQNDTICAGGSATITANVNLAGGTYTWSPIISATNAITVTPNATASYQVIYSLLGCADTSTAELFVKPVSIPTVANETICNGQTAELIATANIPGGSFVWSTTTINDTIQVSPSSTTTYSVVYNLNGCISPIVNSIVTVNPVPTLGVNNSTICAGDNATITAIPNLLGGTFYWGTPGVIGAASQTVSPLNDSTISVYYTLNGCTSPVATSSITVNPLPIATFSASVTQGCAPLSVTLTADDASNTNYTWSTSNALTGTGSQTSLQFQMNGGFDVSLTTTLNGCTVTETLANYIQVDNYPIAAFEPSSTMFTEPNQTLNFMNNSLGASNYAWNFGDGGTSTEEGPNHTFVGNELGVTVVLTAISNLGCTDTSQYFIGYDPGLVYYIPNSFTPDGDMNNQVFTPIFTSGIDNYNYTFYVFNRWGEIIFESNDPSIGWDGSYGVEGKDAEVGVYTYQIFIKIPNFDERKMIVGHVNLIR